jgi:type IX secretion system PorP/SprF family membrane protein
MNRFCKILLLILIGFQTGNVFGQDPFFSQFYAAPLHLSPSLAGISSGSRVSMNFRDQWPKLPGNFVTYSFSYDHNVRSLRSGFGVFALQDKAGSGNLSTTQIGGLYSYRIKVNHYLTLRPGMHFMYAQRKVDFEELIFIDQLYQDNPGAAPSAYIDPTEDIVYVDFSSSLLAYSKDFWAGFTLDHLLKPNQSLTGSKDVVPYKLSIFGGSQFNIKGNMRALKAVPENVTWAINYKVHLGNNVPIREQNSQLDFGLYWHKMPMVLGVWYRGIPFFKTNKGHEAIVLLFGYKIDELSIGYSYDFTVSKLLASTGGAHEISLTYLFDLSKNRKVKRTRVPCPHF